MTTATQQKVTSVPLLDLKPQLAALEREIKDAVLEVVDSTRYIMGPKVTELEARVAEYCGAKFGIGVTSGTDALLIALMALDIKPGDVVVTTAYSFFATAGVIARLNAKPAFVDIDPDTYNMCPNSLRQWFADNSNDAKNVKAIIPVHLYGQCADMDPILEFACERNIAVVEDAAQAIGAQYPSKSMGVRKAGSMGMMGCFSFFPSKNLGAMGDGGMVVTNDDALAEKLTMLRNHGAKPKYFHSIIGGNFRLDPMQAAILLVKLPHLNDWHSGRQANAARYDKSLALPQLRLPKVAYERAYHIYNQYVISVEDRDGLRKHLADANIGTEIYYPVPFHEQECFAYLGYKVGDLPHSEYAARHTIALPIYPELTDAMQDYVAQQIGAFYE